MNSELSQCIEEQRRIKRYIDDPLVMKSYCREHGTSEETARAGALMGIGDWVKEEALIRSAEQYPEFLERKTQHGAASGFEPVWMPSWLFDFQADLAEFAIRKGRAAVFADCGMGKTLVEFVFAENVVRKTGKNALILTPLAVGAQMVRQADQFSMEVHRFLSGTIRPGITIANYERLHLLNSSDFEAVILDESGILKSFDGVRRKQITEFMRNTPYRLLCTATAAPNDYTELGTSSEALGYMGHMDMLTRFFKNDQNTIKAMAGRFRDRTDGKWRFKGHAEIPFWRWVSSWARACRRPSDLGFSDGRFILPKLTECQHLVEDETLGDGMLFAMPAVGLKEQREERRRTIQERCETAASLATHTDPVLVWCHLNEEATLLESMLPDCAQISGADSDEAKEEKFMAFITGESRGLITKPVIGAWGLNLQHCWREVCFPWHSFEQYYQAVRRCWRFGQAHDVTVDIVTTEGQRPVLENMERKARASDRMFSAVVKHMREAAEIKRTGFEQNEVLPTWL